MFLCTFILNHCGEASVARAKEEALDLKYLIDGVLFRALESLYGSHITQGL